jgi:moderate conductance mechanosensitive channel
VARRRAVMAEGSALLPAALSSSLTKVSGGRGAAGIASQLAWLLGILLAGAAAAWPLRRVLLERGLRPEVSSGSGLAARLAAAALRFALDLLPFAAFALFTLAIAHFFFAAGSADRDLVFAYVTGAILVSAAAVLLRLLLSPHWPALRLLPIGERAAVFLYRWLLLAWAVAVFGWLSAGLLILTGVPLQAHLVMVLMTGAAVGLILLLMILAARAEVGAAIRAGGDSSRLRTQLADTWHLFAIVYLAAIWVFWAANMLDQGPSKIWAAIASVAIVLVFPLLDRWIGRSIDDMVGEPGSGTESRRQGAASVLRGVMRVLLAVMLIAGVNELWGFDTFGEAQVRLRQALLASSFDLVAAFALAVLGWQLIKVAIDRRLEVREVDGMRVEPSPRLRTLLPLTRKFLVTVLIVMTAMLILSGLGVNIGPLLAGAGVVGLAIGFGAQTLVRDIITGVFFIMDDAFRVGEYIQSGNYKGTVESIGLRSIKLRHHRGPIFVVPFGELRAVQNLSRDWVIDKLTIGITYDSDLEKAKKLIKKIGQELAQDPEFAPHILETLKMQGVEEFGDYAIQVRMKMMTKPGEQFVIRRRAYAMIKKAFDSSGIKFASPTVQVSGGGDAAAAAAAVLK